NPYPVVTFDQVLYDTDNLWSVLENCFVIPPTWLLGVKVRFVGQVVFTQNSNGARQILVQRKSRSNANSNVWEIFSGQPIQNTGAIAPTTTDVSFSSAVLQALPGDKYALMPWQTSGITIDISGGTGTFFAIEIVE